MRSNKANHDTSHMSATDSLGVEQQARDKDHNDSKELQKTHTDERVGKQIFLHGWVPRHTHNQCCEQLANALSASANGNHGDGTSEHGDTSVTFAQWSAETRDGGESWLLLECVQLLRGGSGHEAS